MLTVVWGYALGRLYDIPNVIFALILLWCCFPFRRHRLALMGLCTTVGHETVLNIFAVYVVLLLGLTVRFFHRMWFSILHGWSVVPPKWFRYAWNFRFWILPTSTWEWVMLAGNILLFLPLGLLLPLGWRKQSWKTIALIGVLVSLGIEIVQWVLGTGWLDLQDVFTNTMGTLLGFVVYHLLPYHFWVRKVEMGSCATWR